MINLKRLELDNFLSHVSTSIDLSSYEGLVLIEGKTHDGHYSSNGAGKSSILEGIVYALTGDTLRGVSVNDVVNRNYKKNTKVSLSFDSSSSDYIVGRYRKDDKFGDSIVLFKDGEDISKRVNKETQKSLEDILGISYKVLVSTMLLGEGLSSRFTQLSDPEKKSLIESTLNLNYDLNKIRETANEELKKLKLDSARVQGEIGAIESILATDIDSLYDCIYDERQCIELYKTTVDDIQETYDNLIKEIEAINPKITLITDSLHKVEVLSKSYTDIMSTNAKCQEERDRVLNTESPICHVCHQPLQSKESLGSVIDDYNSMIKENIASLERIDEELSKLPNHQLLSSKLASLESERRSLMSDSRNLMNDINEYNVKIARSEKDIESMEATIRASLDSSQKLEEKRQEENRLGKDIEKYEYFYKLFSPTGIIVNILSEAVEYINTRLSTYSEILLEKDYRINFLKGKISLVDSKGSNYQSLSNGEKRRLDISIQFALHDYVSMYCGVKMDTLFVDEILDTLDDIGVDNIFDVLRLKLEYCGLHSIYVITHNNSLKSKFDQVITIAKDSDGNSKLV